MIRRSLLFYTMIMALLTTGCLKETYDMKKVSEKLHLSPALAFPAIKGDFSLSDLVKSGDTIVFDDDKFVRLVFKKDSLLDLRLDDFYDFNNMVTYSQSYVVGNMAINPFRSSIEYTLDQIRTSLGQPYYTIFGNLDGTTAAFPSFPAVNIGKIPFPVFTNFENVIFSSGYLVISITNKLPAPLKPVNIKLFNTADNSAIGSEVIIASIPAGETRSDSVNLTDVKVTNEISAEIVLSGSQGNTTPNLIDLDNNSIQITLMGRDTEVKSGRVLLPENVLTSLNGTETITFDPGSGIEIDELKIASGSLSYHIQKPVSLNASIKITLPTTYREGIPVSELIDLNSGTVIDDSISFTNTLVDLGSDPDNPFNSLPYNLSISSTGMIDFKSTDEIKLDLRLLNPDLDYVKGYFGKQQETIEPETINLEIEEILKNITGPFYITNPSITVNYKNSFSIPIEIELNATGKRSEDTVNLDLAPFILAYPLSPPAVRDISGSKLINKDNTNLPKLISMPPEEIRFSGSAKMNPLGDPGNLRNNYLFGDSRFLGDIEIEVPMEFRFNLQFTDTLDNFLADVFEDESEFSWDDLDSLKMVFNVKNGFPVGLALTMNLYDSDGISRNLSSIDASNILGPAPVDNDGWATGFNETSTSIRFTKEFFSSIKKADKMILNFTLKTTNDGSKDVKIKSDYRIDFTAAIAVKPDINIK